MSDTPPPKKKKKKQKDPIIFNLFLFKGTASSHVHPSIPGGLCDT